MYFNIWKMSINYHKHLLDCADCKRSDIFQEHAGLFLTLGFQVDLQRNLSSMKVWKPMAITQRAFPLKKKHLVSVIILQGQLLYKFWGNVQHVHLHFPWHCQSIQPFLGFLCDTKFGTPNNQMQLSQNHWVIPIFIDSNSFFSIPTGPFPTGNTHHRISIGQVQT